MIVMITGLKTSGKNSASNVIVNEFEFIPYAFADPIKQACKEVFLLNDEQLDGVLKEALDERWGMSPREMFQLVGTELFREHLPDIHKLFDATVADQLWVRRFIEVYKQKPMNYVITDWRFPNENRMVEAYCRVHGIPLVKIRISRVGLSNEDSHASEAMIELLPVNYVVQNNGTLEELDGKIRDLMYSILGPF